MSKTLSQLGEFKFIDLVQKQIGRHKSVIQGIGDDTAVLPLSGDKYQLMTTDMLIKDVHFTGKDSPFDIGYKSIACSLSDIAAMGGTPQYAVISIGLPKHVSVSKVLDLYKGMQKASQPFGVHIVGGDTVKNDKLIINVTLVGDIKKKDLVLRSGAKVGDIIFVTGPLGDSLASKHHLKFKPRIKEAQFLVSNFKPSSMIDISDGLVSDLGHLCWHSYVGADIFEEKIPKRNKATLKQALEDGEDYELCFTLDPKKAEQLYKRKGHLNVFPVGEIKDKKQGLVLHSDNGKQKKVTGVGYNHFQE